MSKILPSLKAMAEDKTDDTIGKSVTTFLVDPATIDVVPGHNGRPISRDRVEGFKLAIRNHAVFPALDIRVVDGRRKLVDGEHRLTAYMELRTDPNPVFIEKVLCLELKNANDADVIEHMIAKNDGFALTPLQLGIKYKELLALGRTNTKIANRFGKSTQHVADCLRLAGADMSVQDAITRGEIKSTAALKVVKAEGSKAGAIIKAAVKTAKAAGKKKVTTKSIPVARDKLGDSYVDETRARIVAVKKHLNLMYDSLAADNPARDAVKTVMGAMKAPLVAPPPVGLPALLLGYGAHPDAAIRDAASVLYRAATSGETMPASLVEAITTERDGAGMVMAETLCPQHAELIAYLRSTGAQ